MAYTKQNNPHTNARLAPKNKGKKPVKAAWVQPTYEGHKQFGDYALYGQNPRAYFTQYHVSEDVVGPGDIVDTVEPGKLYTYYLFNPSDTSDDSARELDRLRRGGYRKCEAPRFISPTEKFETRDGVLMLGRRVWYFVEYARKLANREKSRRDEGPNAVAESQDGIAAAMKAEGAVITDLKQSVVPRGQRT